MRITAVIGVLGGGGAERVCVNLANAWAAAGRAVTLLTVAQCGREPAYAVDALVARDDVGWPPRELRDDPEPVLAALRDAGCEELACDAPLIAALRTAILRSAPDVVVAHIDLTNVRVLAALDGTGIPVIACEHTDVSRVFLGPWQRPRELLYRRAAAVVAPHRSGAEWLACRGIAARAIPNALLPPRSRERRPAARRRAVTMARLSPEKRVGLLIGAFRRVADDFPEWDLDVYGDGPLRGELGRLADGRVRLRGFTGDPYAELAAADLFVSTSWVEGFGNAIWEALACGVPVVALDCGAPVRTLVRDGVDGRIVAGGEHALSVALAEAMGDDALRARFGARAAEVVARYPIETALRMWDEVLCGAAAAVRA